MTLRRPALLLPCLVALALAVGACGGGDDDGGGGGEAASSSTDVNQLLTDTFSGSKEIKSGNVDLKIAIDAQGGNSQLSGPVNVTLSGPFQSQGGGALPEFDLQASLEGGGQNLKAGVTSTGDKGFVSFQGTDYVLDDHSSSSSRRATRRRRSRARRTRATSLATLGVDPRKWLTDPQNAGEAKVGDTDTIKITGGVDVAKLLDDVNAALEKASSLGVSGAQGVPEKLTEQQRQQVLDAVKDPKVEIYTGKDDKILRRMVVNMGVDAAGHDGHGRASTSRSDRPQRGPGHRRAAGRQAVHRAARPARRARPRRRRARRPARARRRAARAAAALRRGPREVLATASRRPARTSTRRASAPTS